MHRKIFQEKEIIIEDKLLVFKTLSQKEKDFLSKSKICTPYKKGEMIFKEGDSPSGLICLVEGKVKIFKEGVGGREQIIRMTRPITLIGYRALFADDQYISSAVAIEDSFICTYEKEAFFKVLRTNSMLGVAIIRHMATELGFSNLRTVNLTQKHIRGRLAESLLFLYDTYGTEDDKTTIRVYLSREDIANLSNMTTSNAIRTLSIFASENVISIDGRRIKILNLEQLRKISELG